MLASSLLIRFSSSSRALAFLKSAMNCTKPRILELLLLERPRKPPPVEEAISEETKTPFRCPVDKVGFGSAGGYRRLVIYVLRRRSASGSRPRVFSILQIANVMMDGAAPSIRVRWRGMWFESQCS